MIKRKKICVMLAALAISLLGYSSAFACTGIVVGKNATDDGSIIIGRTEDISSAYNKNFIVVPAKTFNNGEKYKDVNGFTIEQPEKAFKYTLLPDSPEHGDGDFGAAGMNEQGVSMSATISADVNDDIYDADPYVDTGICESAIPSVILPRVSSAREGVETLGKIVDEHGAGEGSIVLFADNKEAWYMEILSGHQWAAVKVPDDEYAVIPNAFMLGYIDLDDKENVIASDDIINMPQRNGLLKTYDDKFHLALTYGTEMSSGNRLRAWGGQHFFTPSENQPLDTPVFDLFKESDKKISLEDVMELQRYRYEDTEYNVNLPENKGKRAIGTEAQAECHIFQIKPDYPKEVGALMWMTMGNAEHSVYLPSYGGITDTNDAYKVTGLNYNPDSAYWTFRGLSTLSEIDRENYGQGVRDFWKEYQEKLIDKQKKEDEKVIYLAKTNKEKAAQFMTEDSINTAENAIDTAKEIYSQLFTYIAKRSTKKPFEPEVSIDIKYDDDYTVTETTKAYFDNVDNWSNLKIYVYTENADGSINEELSAWPGEDLISEGDGLYSFTLPEKYENSTLIFSGITTSAGVSVEVDTGEEEQRVKTEKLKIKSGESMIYKDGKWEKYGSDDDESGTKSSYIKKVNIKGTAKVGNILSAQAIDESGKEITDELDYQWYRSTTEGGAYLKIDYADNKEYKLTSLDKNQYIKAAVTDKNGNEVYSEPTSVVLEETSSNGGSSSSHSSSSSSSSSSKSHSDKESDDKEQNESSVEDKKSQNNSVNENNIEKQGWISTTEGWKYIESGKPVVGWKNTGDKWYYMNNEGIMMTGWQMVNNKWYYLNDSGDMATGWKLDNNKWYYLNESGDMADGWKLVNDKWYYLNGSGDMATGWKLDNNKWYYLNESGDMATGWKEINGVWYYLNSDGSMEYDTVIDGYALNESGALISTKA